MINDFDLDLDFEKLVCIANQMEMKVRAGLNFNNQEIACLPTYVPISVAPKSGRALVLDLGGTHARAALVTLDEGKFIIEKRSKNEKSPWQSGIKVGCQNYLNFLFELIASLNPSESLPLGYCFSFPTESQPNGDAKLIGWTKEVFVQDTVGRLVGSMLTDYLEKKGIRCSKVTVINDTVATLLNGLVIKKADFRIGLIVGTGTNIATIIEAKKIPKLKAVSPVWKDRIPINLEAGNFNPPFLTRWDNAVDVASDNPAQHRFEKAVSGRYLGHLFKAMIPDSRFNPDSGSKGIVKLGFESDECDSFQPLIARQIIERSAKLVAASLAGLLKVLNSSGLKSTVNIVAEGGLISDNRSGYGELTKETLRTLMGKLGLSDTKVDFEFGVKDANLKGSVLAVLAK